MTGKEFEKGYERLNTLLLEAQLAGSGKSAKITEAVHLRQELLADAESRGYRVIQDPYMGVLLQRPMPRLEYVAIERVEEETALLKFMAMEMRRAMREVKTAAMPLTDLDKQLMGS